MVDKYAAELNSLGQAKFPLLRRLSIASFVAMCVTASLLMYLYWQDQISGYKRSVAEKNTTILAHLGITLEDNIFAALSENKSEWGQPSHLPSGLDSLFSSALDMIQNDDVLKLKLYDKSGTTIYSSATDEIGGGSYNPEALLEAIRGKTVHKIETRDSFSGRAGEMGKVYLAITYIPLIKDKKQVGVFEIYVNAGATYERVQNNIINIFLAVVVIFLGLYTTLFISAFKADRAVALWRRLVIENEERCKFALEGAGDGVWDWNPQTDEALYSKQWKAMLGYAEHEFKNTGTAFLEHLHPDDRDQVVFVIENYFAGNQPTFVVEFRVQCKDGSWKWILGRGTVLSRDADGNPVRMLGTHTDIDDRKKTEADLRIAAVAIETHEAIVITDAQSRIIRVNRAFSNVTGYSAEEVMGENPRIMNSGHHDDAFYIEMWQQLLHVGLWAGEIWDKRKNGEIYPKWITITAVKNDRQETTHYVGVFSDITARKRMEEEIHNLAFYDALTNLPNRRLFLDRLSTALTASARRKDLGAVLFIDLDRFKALNDTLGHDHGDLLLIEVGTRIKLCVREMDTVARFGGDEFVVLLEAVGKDRDDVLRKIALVAEKIRKSLAEPYILKGHEHHSSPSIGVNLFRGNSKTKETLIEHADMAMYQAKKSGRNAVRFFDPVMQNKVTSHDALDNDLHHAISLDQLHLHYQMQVDKDQRPIGAEAFLRWEHPEHGMIMPDKILRIAEESDLILTIGRWVLSTACRQLAMWGKSNKTKDLTLTINISSNHFDLPDFAEEVANLTSKYQADPNRLKLELSEKVVMSDINNSMEKISILRNLGVRLSMDNFGTVYSSLSFVKQLSSDELKIHREFVQGIASDGSDSRLIKAISNLANSLNLDLFAEGVETEEQMSFLKANDCHTYQGYLFSKPVAIEDFDKLLES